jgi:hypothetical protein
VFGEIERGKIIGGCDQFLVAQGVEVLELVEYSRLHEVAASAAKGYLTPLMSPSHHDLTAGNSLWLVAWRGDEPVMLGAARLEELGAERVSSFWPRCLERLYNRPKGELIESVSEDVSSVLRGRLAYFGDLHVSPSFRGNLQSVRAFVTIGHLAVSLKWDPDFTYAFVREKDALRGASIRYGFMDAIPSPMIWKDPPSPRSNSEWCVFTSRERLPSMARAVLAGLKLGGNGHAISDA